LQDHQFTLDVTRIPRCIKAVRQVEAVELVIASKSTTVAHAEALVKATPLEQLADLEAQEKEKTTAPIEQLVELEKERNQVQEQYIAVKPYIDMYEPEILEHFELLVDTVSMGRSYLKTNET
jgi:hypothetical protein